ncbi:pilus assembly protein TadG-related protein [Hamadaea tsunoensis]|uniref:pilus assembly protein TadG-related protein n=1 Tax=Hamadaea tsunoensis TaxID=53368 RepID=UPI0003FC6487|nr:TadE/TadG family type IV pilus assembly protein [Hamadaea tsunoensis]
MPRLSTPRAGLRRVRLRLSGGRRQDRGGVAVLFGILLSTGVLLGVGALVVDVGQIYAERETQQSGADAAAMSVALDCANRRTEKCRDDYMATARQYANANALDGKTDVVSVCGRARPLPGDTSSWLRACSRRSAGDLTDCIGAVPTNTYGYVEVHTRVLTSNDRFILPPTFSQAIAGGGSGTDVRACSRVAWGTPTIGFPLAVCTGEFNFMLRSTGGLVAAPPVRPPASKEWWVGLDDEPSSGCSSGGSRTNWGLTSEAGWLAPNAADPCEVKLTGAISRPTMADTPPGPCTNQLELARSSGQPLAIPILSSTGRRRPTYRLDGVAAFVVTGYRLRDGTYQPSTLTGNDPCPGEHCVAGYFTQAITPGSEWTGNFGTTSRFYGAATVKTVG